MPSPVEPPTTAPLAEIVPDQSEPAASQPAEPAATSEPDLEALMPLEEITPDPIQPESAQELPPDEPVMPLDQPAAEPVLPEQPPVALPTNDDLFELKQQALAQLGPLVDQLDQTPEEKFRTKMMMIQSTDDQSLIKEAYEAAQQITDEKVRAQALLDVINEINYFTAQHQ
jgi:hypothetical protein